MAQALKAVLALSVLLVIGASPSLAQVSQAEAEAMIEESFAVEVLEIERGSVDGEPVWMVTVMNTGGDFNEAFKVTTLAVHRQSGELVPAYRSGPNGSGGGEIIGGADKEGTNPTRARGGVWR